jgi:hypothetical protein
MVVPSDSDKDLSVFLISFKKKSYKTKVLCPKLNDVKPPLEGHKPGGRFTWF